MVSNGQSVAHPRDEAYFPQLDGVRAIAVALVLVQHWITNPLNVPAPFGFLGVTIFFVLSGYLISRILIAARARQEAGRSTLASSLKTFYFRRFLRIFPIYYLTLFALYVAGFPAVRDGLAWHITYTSNFQFLLGGDKHGVEHLWTLAVEEQYYLFYPLLILIASAQRRFRALISMIALAFVSRIALHALGVSVSDNKYFTLCCFDSFALGGILAHAEHVVGKERALAPFRRPATAIGVGAFTVAFLAFGAVLGDAASMREVWFRFILSIASLYLVGVALSSEITNPLNRILMTRPLRYVGKISYGVYLYHLYAGHIAQTLLPFKNYGIGVRFVLLFTVTIVVSTASWFLIEKPINGLKKRFAY